jgi:hypothetical protein
MKIFLVLLTLLSLPLCASQGVENKESKPSSTRTALLVFIGGIGAGVLLHKFFSKSSTHERERSVHVEAAEVQPQPVVQPEIAVPARQDAGQPALHERERSVHVEAAEVQPQPVQPGNPVPAPAPAAPQIRVQPADQLARSNPLAGLRLRERPALQLRRHVSDGAAAFARPVAAPQQHESRREYLQRMLESEIPQMGDQQFLAQMRANLGLDQPQGVAPRDLAERLMQNGLSRKDIGEAIIEAVLMKDRGALRILLDRHIPQESRIREYLNDMVENLEEVEELFGQMLDHDDHALMKHVKEQYLDYVQHPPIPFDRH